MTQIGFSESGESVGAVRAHDARSESEESMPSARGFSESGESVAQYARRRAGPGVDTRRPDRNASEPQAPP